MNVNSYRRKNISAITSRRENVGVKTVQYQPDPHPILIITFTYNTEHLPRVNFWQHCNKHCKLSWLQRCFRLPVDQIYEFRQLMTGYNFRRLKALAHPTTIHIGYDKKWLTIFINTLGVVDDSELFWLFMVFTVKLGIYLHAFKFDSPLFSLMEVLDVCKPCIVFIKLFIKCLYNDVLC